MSIESHEHPNFGRGKYRVAEDAVNHEFRRKLWEGYLPIKVILNYMEISSNMQPRSLYMMVPRLNYFTNCLEKIKAFFDEYVSLEGEFSDMWLEFNGQPLRWDVPIGVQFDTLIGLGSSEHPKTQNLPWQLCFHYKGCPDEQMARLQKNGQQIGIKYIRFNYINSLKESHVLRMGTANEILAQMKKYEEEKLLDGIQKHSYELFWEINQTLCDKHIANLKKYAIRIFSNKFTHVIQPCFEIGQFQGSQSDIEKKDTENQQKFEDWEQRSYDVSLGEMLIKTFPGLFKQEIDEDLCLIKPTKSFDVICHGLKIDLATPMYWLQLNMSYLDNFLYLSFHCY